MRHALIHGAFLEAEYGIKLINFPAPKIGLRGTLQTHSKKVGLTHSELVGFGIGFGEILEWVLGSGSIMVIL